MISRVVNVSPSARVEANAIPIAESASVHRIPPWTVPIGLWCLRPASISKRDSPSAKESIRNPTSSAAGGWRSPLLSFLENEAAHALPSPDGFAEIF